MLVSTEKMGSTVTPLRKRANAVNVDMAWAAATIATTAATTVTAVGDINLAANTAATVTVLGSAHARTNTAQAKVMVLDKVLAEGKVLVHGKVSAKDKVMDMATIIRAKNKGIAGTASRGLDRVVRNVRTANGRVIMATGRRTELRQNPKRLPLRRNRARNKLVTGLGNTV